MEMARASLATPAVEKIRNTPHQEFKNKNGGLSARRCLLDGCPGQARA
jgi:hypothetical protein